MIRVVSVGECMVERSPGDDCWRGAIAGDTCNTAWYVRTLSPETWQVVYLTSLGGNPVSDQALQVMRDNGNAMGLVQRHPSRSFGLCAISRKSDERSFDDGRDTSAARRLTGDRTTPFGDPSPEVTARRYAAAGASTVVRKTAGKGLRCFRKDRP